MARKVSKRQYQNRWQSAVGPTDPAFSRNPKPPPLGGGVFILYDRAVIAVKTAIYKEIKTRNGPSLYAPPLAWAVVHFAQRLVLEQRAFSPRDCALIVASDECSLGSIREIGCTAKRGTISPLRFAGSSPSILVGLPAHQLGIRGPTLCLTMPPKNACCAIAAMTTYWFKYNAISTVIAISHYTLSDKSEQLNGLFLRSDDPQAEHQIMKLGQAADNQYGRGRGGGA